jgi:hypothetical protein
MDIILCVDCAMFHANGEAPEHAGPIWFATVFDRLGDAVVAVGDDYGFSWRWCDSCGSTLGGDRFEATLIER